MIPQIGIHREVGGDLAEVLDTVAETIRERNQVMRQVKSLTAEGRLSAWILGLMPFALAGLMNIFNPAFMSPLWTDPMGLTVVKYMLAMMVVGVVILRKIVKIRV